MTTRLILAIALTVAAVPECVAEARRATPPSFTGAKQPQVAVAEGGQLHVVFGLGNEVYATRSDDAGVTFSPPAKVGALEKLALGMRRGPRIAAVGRVVTVAAISHSDGNLYSWRSEDGGATWSSPVTVNTVPNSAREGLHALASGGDSRLAAVWLDLRNDKTELWGSFSNDGGRTWNGNTRIYRSPDLTICECCHPSVIFTSKGDVVVMWRNWLNGARDMFQAASSDGGKTFSAPTKLGSGTWKLLACPMDGGSLAATEDAVCYAWRRESMLFTTSQPSAETVLAESGAHPVVIRCSDRLIYVWQDGGRLLWKPSLAEEARLLAAKGGFAAGAWNPHKGESVIVWEGADGIYAETLSGH